MRFLFLRTSRHSSEPARAGADPRSSDGPRAASRWPLSITSLSACALIAALAIVGASGGASANASSREGATLESIAGARRGSAGSANAEANANESASANARAGGAITPPSSAGAPPNFSTEILPLLASRCFACHGPDESTREAGLRLDQRDGALASRAGGAAIVPGDASASLVVQRVREAAPERRMPPAHSGLTLDEADIARLEAWIDAGAEYGRHWAFVPPRATEPPAVARTDWPRGAIDHYVLARLEAEGLEPSPEADRSTLLRRLSFDLIGLPPTPSERAAFLASPLEPEAAYRAEVERLLASPQYAERWASVWLDLARYADSAGYGSDPLREIWRYRDWVIEAFDRNLDYRTFTRLQLAGDLELGAGIDERLATAFHRNTMTNTEGGTDDEEFRVAAVKDRVDTTMQVWMGLTAGCAQCHSHKFDPLSHREYYQLFAIFNQTADADRNDDSPRLATPTREQELERLRLQRELPAARAALKIMTPKLEAAHRAWVDSIRERWRLANSVSATSAGGATIEVDGEWLAVRGLAPDRDRYRLECGSPVERPLAVALELDTDPALPNGGPGRSPNNGNFVLGDLRLRLLASGPAPPARALRVRLPGDARFLSLAEVEIFADGVNIAASGRASQSSTDFGGAAARAIDGNTSGVYDDGSVTHTALEANPWWRLDFDEPRRVDAVTLWNRTDGELEARLDGAFVEWLGDEDRVLWSTGLARAPDPSTRLEPASFEPEALFVEARADFEQQGYPVAAAIDDSLASGWAIAPRVGEAHTALFRVLAPDGAFERAGGRFALELAQEYGGSHTIGRLRVWVSDHPSVATLPYGTRLAISAGTEFAPEEREALLDEWRAETPLLAEERALVQRLEAEQAALRIPTTPVMEELPPEQRRETHVLVLGNFLQPAEAVEAAFPEAFHRIELDGELPDRADLARWLTSEENPLTARVAVNRLWARLFGTGIVATEEDFGLQGELPSHLELLDHLALEFMARGWDQKELLRRMVTSSTYRQASRRREAAAGRDPANRLLWRGPRHRLSAEQLWDQALALSGLLNPERFGPSVYPQQPDGLWQAAFNGQRTWPTSTGKDRYRRALYTYHRRTIPHPSMTTFDVPSREMCTPRRLRTNTPLQAFVTLNDPVYVDAARALARRILREGGANSRDRARYGLELCTGRNARAEAVDAIEGLVQEHAGEASLDEEAALTYLNMKRESLPPGISVGELAGWTLAANVLLNMDAVLVKD